MKRFLAIMSVFLLLAGAGGLPVSAHTLVVFEDDVLAMRVADALGVPYDSITSQSMEGLLTLDVGGDGIWSLAGLEHAVNLEYLNLNLNHVTDLSPIAGLTELNSLHLSHNGICDISPLSGLANLVILDLSYNLIQDVSALNDKLQLQALVMDFNLVQNITPLSGLDNLMILSMWDNQVSDITALGTHPSLIYLNMGRNQVSSLTALESISNLQYILMDHNSVTSISPLSFHSQLEVVSFENNKLTNYDTLLGLNWLSFVDLRFNTTAPSSPVVNQLENAGATVWHGERVHFNDPYLDNEIRRILQKSPSADITRADMATLTTLDLGSKELDDLWGLEYAVNLQRLCVPYNYLTDLTPVRYLLNLEQVCAWDNYLYTTWEYMGHPKLKHLLIDENQIYNIDFIRDMPNLESLKVDGNNIAHIRGMSGLPKLNFVNLTFNRLQSLEGLANLTSLTGIRADNNFIHSLSSLGALTKLDFLSVVGNMITDISPVQTLPLVTLYLCSNPISEISPLLNIPALTSVSLWQTEIDLTEGSEARKVIQVLKGNGVHVKHNYYEKTPIERLAGNNRYLTATAISQKGWEQAEVIVLARGDNYADALAGVPLAHSLGAPILLTTPNVFSPETKAEIERLGATQIIILGGTGAISSSIEQELIGLGYQVDRIQGASRYETAANIARRMCPEGVTHAVVAFGNNFPDALAAASYAAREGYPILLTLQFSIPDATSTVLSELGVTNTIVAGGTGVISNQVMDLLPDATRVAGNNRFSTSVALANHFGSTQHMYVATGMNFADAITGAVLAAKEGTGLLLVGGLELDYTVRGYIVEADITSMTIFGGSGAVSDDFRYYLWNLLP